MLINIVARHQRTSLAEQKLQGLVSVTLINTFNVELHCDSSCFLLFVISAVINYFLKYQM
jgi:hypothetical protein